MKNLIVIKFGGSSITKKAEGKYEMNYDVLKQTATELKQALQTNPKLKIVLVCGVGPFGHTNVVKYDLNNGIKTPEQEKGVKITNNDCDFVGTEVAKSLNAEGIKTKIIHGYDVCTQENKKVKKFDLKPYKKALEERIISITTGVMVKDKTLNWSVMSGDQVIAQISKKLAPQKVIIGTDVDGIFTSDPKEDKKAELIPIITKNNLSEVLKKASNSKAVDVTGGMKGKLEKLAETLYDTKLSETLDGIKVDKKLHRTECEIFNLFTPGNLKKAVLRKKITSTVLRL